MIFYDKNFISLLVQSIEENHLQSKILKWTVLKYKK